MLEKNKNSNLPVIKSESVYKIFGNNAEKLLKESEGKVRCTKIPRCRMYSWCKQCFI